MSDKTIFKRIIDREIPAKIAYEDECCLAFHDITPQAPTHVLIIPKKEIPKVDDLTADDDALVGHLFRVAARLAGQLGLSGGYRLVVNNGPDAGQAVLHLHVHLLGGRALHWPPG
jgi:histidine triad (HIT) family protein